MEYQEIRFQKEGEIARLTLANPKRINALSKNMIKEMIHALSSLLDDETVKVVILDAEGKHFCAGHNLSEMTDQGAKGHKFIFDQCAELMRIMHSIPQPVIAQVQGIATAAGCQVVAWADMAVCSETARFGTPGVKIGLFCITPMVAIARAIGRKAAMEMLMTGRYFSAEEAKLLGLVNRVVAEDKLAEETENLAKEIIPASRFVIGLGKEAFYAQIDQPDTAAFHYAKNTIALNNMAEDATEGIKAFVNKETPVWKNR